MKKQDDSSNPSSGRVLTLLIGFLGIVVTILLAWNSNESSGEKHKILNESLKQNSNKTDQILHNQSRQKNEAVTKQDLERIKREHALELQRQQEQFESEQRELLNEMKSTLRSNQQPERKVEYREPRKTTPPVTNSNGRKIPPAVIRLSSPKEVHKDYSLKDYGEQGRKIPPAVIKLD